MKPLNIIFFGTRCLRKLNKKLKVRICTMDIKVLYYIHKRGPMSIRSLSFMTAWKRIKWNIIPRLMDAGFVHFDGKHYRISIDGLQYLKEYADMLNKARVDRINRKGDTSKPVLKR